MALAAVAAVAALGATQPGRAATQIWDPSQTGASGGTGTWDTSSTFWDTTTSATRSQTWVNGNNATFNGTAGTVTLTSGIGASVLTFQTSGYILNSDASGDPLTLNGSSSTINYTPSLSGGTLSVNAVLAGTVGLTLNAAGYASNIYLNGANTFTGVAEMVQATVNLSSLANGGVASALGAGSDNVYLGGSLTSASGSSTNAIYLGTGAGTTNRLWALTGTSSSDAITNNSSNASGGALNFTNTGIGIAGVVGARTLNFGGSYTTTANTFAESLTDLGTGANITAVKVSGDRWILSGTASNYSGATTISSGGLSGIGGQAFGNTSGISVGGSATLGLLGDASTTFATAASAATSTLVPYSVITTASGATINVDEATAAGASAVKTMTIGNISTTSTATAVTFNFTGADNTSLSAGTVTGPTTAAAEVVTIANSIPTATGSLTLGGYISGNTAGGELLTVGGVGNSTITGPITPSATTLTVSKTGSATLSLLGSSTYTGGTNISAGTVSIAQGTSVGTGPVNFTASSSLTVSAGLTLANPVTIASSVTASFKNGVATAVGGTPSALFNVSGAISGSGNVMLGSQSSSLFGPVELSNNANSFTGSFTTGYGFFEYASVANAGSPSALGQGNTAYALANSTSALTFQYVGGTSTTTTRTLNWSASGTTGNAGPLALDASGVGTVQFLATGNLRSGSSPATLTLQGSNTGANTLAEAINDGTTGTAGFATSVVKSGTGKWVVTGLNTYTGPTTINGGTLVANNATNSLGAASTATVSGTGVVAGTGNTGTGAVVINSGGTITAGSGATTADTIGTLTTGAETWNAGGTFVAKVTGDGATTPSNDTLVLSSLTINATGGASAFNVSLTSLGTTTLNAPLVLAIIPGAAAGTFNTSAFNLITTNIVGGGQLIDQVGTYDGFTGDELVVATPEPTSLLLAAVFSVPLVVGRRRRR